MADPAAATPASASAAAAAPHLFSVDSSGTGAGRIVSESGDVFEGSFLGWKRHGWGVQRWATGEVFRGVWEDDAQARGVFTDTQGQRWSVERTQAREAADASVASALTHSPRSLSHVHRKGDFKKGQVVKLAPEAAAQEEEEEAAETAPEPQQPQQQEQQPPAGHDQREDSEEKDSRSQNVTHFPPSAAYAYQSQHEHADFAHTQSFDRTQPLSPSQFGSTQPLPPQSARSARSSSGQGGARRRGAHTSRRRRAPPPRVAETAAERSEREARETKEEEIVARELKAARFFLAHRYGSSRVPFEATFGLENDTPGPGQYAVPDLAHTRRTGPKITMAPRLPYTTECALNVKSTPSAGPWSSNIVALSAFQPASSPPSARGSDPSRPSAPQVSTSRPPLLPQYVKDSDFFAAHAKTPGPGAFEPRLTARGKNVGMLASATRAQSMHPAPLGGSEIKGRFIPRFSSYAHIAQSQLGQGPDAGEYSPKIDRVAGRPSAPSCSMGRRYNDARNALMRVATLPSPAAYNPTLSATIPSPLARVSGWGKSRSGQRVHPTESTRAIAHPGKEALLRNQMGLISPGPAAYTPNTAPVRPRVSAAGFGPHVVQPPAVRVAAHYIETAHPFVERFSKIMQSRASSRISAVSGGGGAQQQAADDQADAEEDEDNNAAD